MRSDSSVGPPSRLLGSPAEHVQRLRTHALGFFRDGFEQHPDVFTFTLGDVSFHAVADPGLAWQILQTRWKSFVKVQGLTPLLGNGLITSDGDLWRRQRALMQPCFHRRVIEGYFATIASHTEAALDELDKSEPVDIARLVKGLTFRIACDILFGVQERMGDALYQAFVTLKRGNIVGLLTRFAKVPPADPEVEEARVIVRRFVDRLIAERRAETGSREERSREERSREDLLSLLLRARSEDTHEGMSDRQLHDEVLTLMLAGHETTENALVWTLVQLCRSPAHMTEVQAELMPLSEVSLGEIQGLRSLKRAFQESMRLVAPVWQLVPRETRERVELQRCLFEAGDVVMVLPYFVHRHSRVWSEPESFQPERFIHADAIPPGAYIPFGAGPRTCIGLELAYLEALVILAKLLKRFELHMFQTSEPATMGPVVVPSGDVVAHLRQR